MMSPRRHLYSLLLTLGHGGAFLPCCLESILQSKADFELLVCGSPEQWPGSADPRCRFIHCEENLSAAEQRKLLLEHSCGEWVIFISPDEALQYCFFELADLLTARAEKLELQAVVSEPAVYIPPESPEYYNNTLCSFYAFAALQVKKLPLLPKACCIIRRQLAAAVIAETAENVKVLKSLIPLSWDLIDPGRFSAAVPDRRKILLRRMRALIRRSFMALRYPHGILTLGDCDCVKRSFAGCAGHCAELSRKLFSALPGKD